MSALRPYLLAASSLAQVKSVLPLVPLIRERGGEAVFLFNDFDEEQSRHVLAHLESAGERPVPFGVKRPEGWDGRLLTPAGILAAREVSRRAAEHLERFTPRAVILGSDGAYVEKHLIRQARRRGVPTALVHWALTSEEIIARRVRERREKLADPVGRLKLGARRFLRRPLDALDLDLDRDDFLYWGQGEADLVTVSGPFYKKMLERYDLRGRSYHATGNPAHDYLFREILPRREELRRRVREDVGAREEQPLVFYAPSAFFHFGLLGPERYGELAGALGRALKAAWPEAAGVVKVHPKEAARDHRPFYEPFGVPVLEGDYDTDALVAAADLVVVTVSSVGQAALMLGAPLIVFDPLDLGGLSMDYVTEGAALAAGSEEDLEAALVKVRLGGGERQRLDAAGRAYARERCGNLDGEAARRVLDLVEDKLESRHA